MKFLPIQNIEESQKALQMGMGRGGSPTLLAMWDTEVKYGVFPCRTGALRGDVNKQLCHSTSPTPLRSWGTNAAPGNAHGDGEGTPRLPCSGIPNPEPTICCPPYALPWQASPTAGIIQHQKCLEMMSYVMNRSYGGRSPPSSC